MSSKRMKVYKDMSGLWRWSLWSSSDVIADSGQGYRDRDFAVKMAREFMGDAVLDVEPSDEENE